MTQRNYHEGRAAIRHYANQPVLNVVVGAFNQEMALVGAFSVIVQLHRLIDMRHLQCSVMLVYYCIGGGRCLTQSPQGDLMGILNLTSLDTDDTTQLSLCSQSAGTNLPLRSCLANVRMYAYGEGEW